MRATWWLRVLAVVCVVIGIVPLANLMGHGSAVPWYGLAVREWLLRGAIVLAVAAVLAAALGDRLDRLAERVRRALLEVPPPAFVAIVSVVAIAAALFYARFSFAGAPFTTDEMAEQFHARILLSGHLFAIPEGSREFFNTSPIFDRDGRWFSQYPVGGPAFLAVGYLLGAPWLVNPLLLGLTTWALYRFLSLAADELTARLTVLLFVLSPMVLIMSASQMSHGPALAFTMVALAALAHWDADDEARGLARSSAVIGLATGVVATVRPLDAFVVGLAIAVFQIWRSRGAPPRWRSLPVAVLAGALPVAMLLWVNARTTGHPLLFGYEAVNGPSHAIGFHVDPNGQLHTPAHGLQLASSYLMRLSRYLFEWPIPGMLVIVVGLLAVRRPSRWDVLLAALIAAFLVAYGAYWFDGFFAGPRFLYTVVPAFVYFAARAAIGVAAVAPRPLMHRMAVLVVPLCVLAAWVGPTGTSSARGRVAMYREQRTKLKTDIDAQVRRAHLRNALVFVNEGWRGRLSARLRALGVSQFRAERMLNTLDACALQSALDAEDTLAAKSDSDRASRVYWKARLFGPAQLQPATQADQAIALVPGSRPTARCLWEYGRDRTGTLAYSLFLGHQDIGPDGRVDGDVVFARDLGDRNERLRQRFGSRAWYSYRVPSSLSDTLPAFLPYVSP